MREAFVVNAEPRADQGKGASRRLRRTGKVPAIVYGGKDPAQQLALNHHEMAKHLETEAFYSHILTLRLEGKEQQAVLKDVQRHPAEPILLHFDFQRVFADQAIRMHVPLHFKGAEVSPGVKTNGGVVEHYLIQVEVECLPKHLPEFIEVDLSKLDINDTVRMSHDSCKPSEMSDVAMPLATSPALYPPMPSARTKSPRSGRDSMQSSLWSRTRPGSVRLADWSACETLIGALHRRAAARPRVCPRDRPPDANAPFVSSRFLLGRKSAKTRSL